MINNKYCIGIIGFGGMAKWHYELVTGVDGKQGIDNLIIKGVYDIKQSQLELASSLGLVAYPSREALLADTEIDIVLCATPNNFHKECSIAALNAGKNVVCEKPVAMNSDELTDIFEASNKANKLFVVHQNRRWDEDYLTVKKMYDENLLGNIFNIESRVHGSRGIPGDWRGEKEYGGGMVLDWGVHIIDQILMLIKEKVKTVYCTLTNITNELVDDGFKLWLTFESGKTALLEVGTSNFVELPRWYVQGLDGTAVIDDWYLNGKVVRITNWDKNDAVPIKTAAGLTKTMAPRTDETIKTEALPIVKSDIKDFYANVTATIAGKEKILITHNELMRSMLLMESAFKSAELNQVIPFDD